MAHEFHRLGTRQFQTPRYGHIRATPSGFDTWYILWQLGNDDHSVEIVYIGELSL